MALIPVFRGSKPPEKIHSVLKESDFVPQFEGFRSKGFETFFGSVGPMAEPNVFSVFLFLGNSGHAHGGRSDEPGRILRIEPDKSGYRNDHFAFFVEIRVRNVPAYRKRVGFPIRKAGYRRIRKRNGGDFQRFPRRRNAGSFLERFGDFFPNAFRNGSRISGQIGRKEDIGHGKTGYLAHTARFHSGSFFASGMILDHLKVPNGFNFSRIPRSNSSRIGPT